MVVARALDGLALREEYVDAHGLRLHVVDTGGEGPPVVLLHGFPELWFGWRRQLPALAQAGFRVCAPDQRGYNLSDKPPGVRAYTLDALAADVTSMLDSLGVSRAAIVGHDWGAMVAWRVALTAPERVSRLAILNVPHPDVFRSTLRRNPRQMLRSWYALVFQLPWLPELVSRWNQFQMWRMALVATSGPNAFTSHDLDVYVQAWSQPGAFSAMLNWYRALLRFPPRPTPSPRVRVPTLVIWGERDVALIKDMAQASVDLCDDGRLEMLPNASHWVQHDQPEQVNRLLVEFLHQGA